MDDRRSATDRSFDDGARHRLAGGAHEPVILQRASPRAIEWTAEQLASGGVVVIPTDTVYGIAASLAHQDAIHRIFQIKRRASDRPLPVLVSSTDALRGIVQTIDSHVAFLLDRFWPGPLTVVAPGKAGVPAGVLGSGSTIGVRIPNHPLAIEVIEKAGGAIACTSANRSGERPAVTAAEVAATIGSDVDLILDGGIARGGIPSSVVAFAGKEITVLREGAIAAVDIERAWQEILSAHAS